MNKQILVCGHVDTGKSTLIGRLLVDLKYVDKHAISISKLAAQEKGLPTWWLAFLSDIDENERIKGKTHSYNIIKLDKHGITLIDVPGHQLLIKEMIDGALCANLMLLILSAKKGEYESGLSGQTLEHLLIGRGIGLRSLIIVINKMDTIEWNIDIFEQIKKDILQKIEKYNFKNIQFIPTDSYNGGNIIQSYNNNISLIDCINKFDIDIIDNVFVPLYSGLIAKVAIILFNLDKFIISVGFECIIHSGSKIFNIQIVDIIGFKIISSSSDCKKPFNIIIKLIGEKPLYESILSKIIFRKENITIGAGKIIV